MKIVLTPDWFLGKDVMIEAFSFLVLLAFFVLCLRYYKLSKNRNVFYLGSGFLLIAVAQLASIFTKLILYYDTNVIQQIGHMIITYNVVKSVDIFYYLGFFFHRFLTLSGLYIIYRLPAKKIFSEDFFLALYFIIISAIFVKEEYFLFHITAFLLLALIIRNYYKVYKKTSFANTAILILSFFLLALSQLIFIFAKLSANLPVIGNIIELVSYLILLLLIIRILKTRKK